MLKSVKGLEKILSIIPSNSRYTGSMVESWDNHKINIILKDGTRFDNAVKPGGSYRSTYAYDTPEDWDGESVQDALIRLEIPISSILRIEFLQEEKDYREGSCNDYINDEIWFFAEENEKITKDEMIASAAKLLAEKKIGFGEFKRIIKENS